MNKEILEQVLPIVEKTKDGILKGIDIIYQEVPELVDQILKWEFSISVIGVLVGCLFFGIVASFMKWSKSKKLEFDCTWGYNEMIVFWGIACFFAIGNLFFWINLIKAIKIYVAPKLYLLHYITNILQYS